jgi:hypothetical protein
MAIKPEEGMTAKDVATANAAVNKARVANAPKPAPKVDGRAALSKLTGGQALTDEEKKYLNLPVVPPAPVEPVEPIVGGTGSTTTVVNPPAAGTSAGFEDSPDKKQRRQKFHDGQGGYFYGDYFANPDYKVDDKDDQPYTNIDVLKAVLRGKGMPASVVDASTGFLTKVLAELGDYENTAEVFLNMKDYTLKDGTKVSSPFYATYGYLNEGLVNPKTPAELFNFVEGAKGLKSKYGFSDTYLSQDSLKQYVKNGVTVEDLDARANLARLKAIESDPYYVKAAKDMGYITDDTQLTDFFMNSKIGKEALTQNAGVVGIATEAIRRSSTGIKADKTRFEKLSAGMAAQGYSPEQIQATAATAFQTIGESLNPTVKLAGIYDRASSTDADVSGVQAELEQESFNKLASARRKRYEAQEIASFQAQSGVSQYSLSSGSGLGQMF